MRTVRIAAVVLAILGGMFALLGYTTVVRDWVGSAGYGWFLFISVLIIVGGGVAVLSRPQDGSMSERTCRGCGRESQEDWTLCPTCGTRLPRPIDEVARGRRVGEQVEEGRAAEDNEPNLDKAFFWLGIVVLDLLFVLFVFWLFVPSIAPSQKVFSSMGGTLAIVMLDVGITSMLIGYSRTASVIRL